MLLEGFLEQSASARPDHLALVAGEARLTYAEVEARANALAHGLQDLGVRRGDRVLIHLENGVDAVLAIFATLKAGATFVMVNPTAKSHRLAYLLEDTRATALFTDPRRLTATSGAWALSPHLLAVVVAGDPEDPVGADGKRLAGLDGLLAAFRDRADAPPPKRHIDQDLAALIYTSGSTGSPKGVMSTHRNMRFAARSILTYLENVPEDVLLLVLPLSFDYGLYQVLMAFAVGATVVVERGFTYPHAVLNRAVAEGVTGLPVVPTLLAMLLELDLERYDLSKLRYLTNTGAALPVEHIRQVRQRLPGMRVYSMYGLTECKRVAYLPPEEIDARPGSVGRAIPGTEVYLVDDEGHRLGPGQVGQLVVRGSHVMRGYWERPEDTDRVYRPGPIPGEKVLHTGDLFRQDDEGFLYFVGRRDDIIKSRGEKVSPREVEDVLHAMPGIAEAAVVGVPNPFLGQAVKAVVRAVPGATLTEPEVRAHCRRHLEDFMVPSSVEVVDELPRTPNGKIDKARLTRAP